ncbi:MAG: hypothetical protein PGN07_03405 [Aeromicrobium erythreum]
MSALSLLLAAVAVVSCCAAAARVAGPYDTIAADRAARHLLVLSLASAAAFMASVA